MKEFRTQEDYQTAYDAALFRLEIARDQFSLRILTDDLRRLAMEIVDDVARSDIKVTGDVSDLPGVKVEREPRAATDVCHLTTVPCGFESCEVHYGFR